MNNDETFGNFDDANIGDTTNDDLRELAQSTLDMVRTINLYNIYISFKLYKKHIYASNSH